MHAPIITITTDFGTRDPWVGIMKGVMLGICPGAHLVDLSHDIAPQDVLEGALCLEAAARFFPSGTIHLAVVDPGVGSSRRGVAAQAGGQSFVGPDNGLLSLAVTLNGGPALAVELANRAFARSDWKEAATSFDAWSAYSRTSINVIGAGTPLRVDAADVTADLFSTVGVQPLLGRTFTTADDAEGAPARAGHQGLPLLHFQGGEVCHRLRHHDSAALGYRE